MMDTTPHPADQDNAKRSLIELTGRLADYRAALAAAEEAKWDALEEAHLAEAEREHLPPRAPPLEAEEASLPGMVQPPGAAEHIEIDNRVAAHRQKAAVHDAEMKRLHPLLRLVEQQHAHFARQVGFAFANDLEQGNSTPIDELVALMDWAAGVAAAAKDILKAYGPLLIPERHRFFHVMNRELPAIDLRAEQHTAWIAASQAGVVADPPKVPRGRLDWEGGDGQAGGGIEGEVFLSG
jgi:hypothetical protein